MRNVNTLRIGAQKSAPKWGGICPTPGPDKARQHSETAFIYYRPGGLGFKKMFSCNEAAYRVLYPPSPASGERSPISISSLCLKWKKLVDTRYRLGINPESEAIDIITSWRRTYAVKVALLSDQPTAAGCQNEYLFILERICRENANFPMACRRWNLNRRERDMVNLLLEGYGNKQMADMLGLSHNTVKGYMKFLMRKLGVGNRAGIVATLFARG